MSIKSDKIWMDGELVNFEDANVHILTHTLHYGYGAFEGIRAYRREDGTSHVLRLEEHIKRLFESCHILGLKIPFTPTRIMDACVETLRANGFDWGYLRPLVYMGSETMGLGATTNSIRVAIPSWQWGAYLGADGLKKGIRATYSSSRVIVLSSTTTPRSWAISKTLARVIPPRMLLPNGGVISRLFLTMKMFSPVHSDT